MYIKKGNYFLLLLVIITAGCTSSMVSDDAGLHYLKATRAVQEQKWKIAISEFNKAIELDPHNPKALRYRGSIHATMGNHKLAINDYDKALTIDNKYAEVYGIRAISWYHLGDYIKSWADVKQAKITGGYVDPRFYEEIEQIIKSPLITKKGWISVHYGRVDTPKSEKEKSIFQTTILLHTKIEETYIIEALPSCKYDIPPEDRGKFGITFQIGEEYTYLVKGYSVFQKKRSHDGKYVIYEGQTIKAVELKRIR